MPSNPYDFWLLDLDGTIVDIEPRYVHAVFDRIGDRLGGGFSDREAEAIWYDFGNASAGLLESRGIDARLFWETFHAVEDPLARAEATYLYDDAAFVADLDRVGIVTHCQRYLTDPVLESLDIDDWFDVVVCCDDEIGWKPDPAPVERAMRALGVNGNHTGVLAGDGPHDIGAAWNAGLDGVHVERHSHDRRGHCVLGDYRVESFEELATPLKRRGTLEALEASD